MKSIKRIFLMAIPTMLLITGCGINKEMTYKENVSSEEILNPTITQSDLDINVAAEEFFVPLYYKENDILGILGKKEGAMILSGFPDSAEIRKYMYKFNNDNSISETNNNLIANSKYSTSEKSQRGIYTNNEDGKIYYYDRIKGTETEIEVNYKINHDEEITEVISFGDGISGNEDYCLIYQGISKKQSVEYLGVSDITNPVLILKNIKTTEEFVLKDEEAIVDRAGIVYDKVTESFYFISYGGEIKKIDLIKGNIKLKDYDRFQVDVGKRIGRVDINDKGELIIDAFEGSEKIRKYNLKTKEQKVIENPFKKSGYIEEYLPKYNIVIIAKIIPEASFQKEYYIGRINGDEIQIYDKINFEMGENNMVEMAPIAINDYGTELIITLAFSNEEDGAMPVFSHYEYIKINIEGVKNE